MPYKNLRRRVIYKPKDNDDLAAFLEGADNYFSDNGIEIFQARAAVEGRTGTAIKENNFSRADGVFHYRGTTVTVGKLYHGGGFYGVAEFVSQHHSKTGLERLVKKVMRELNVTEFLVENKDLA